MEDYNMGPIPQTTTVVLDYIKEIIFQYRGMKVTLCPEVMLYLLDFIQYLYCKMGKLEKFFWEEEN